MSKRRVGIAAVDVVELEAVRNKQCIDKPSFTIGGDAVTIRLSLESRMIDQGRATLSRYTSADQRVNYPDDTAFNWVETLNDQALNWGS